MPPPIPFESQHDPHTNRGCGAACLAMVYKSFGKDAQQAEIWPLIAKPNRFGVVSSTTHLMALHALGQGFSAVAIQARHPMQVLRLCREHGIRVILNQRPRPEAATGHYTVLVDIDDKTVIVHDPAHGPIRRMTHSELTHLWQPSSPNSEIAGNVLIAIAADPARIPECEFCHTAIPQAVNCPKCGESVGLSPAAMLGCVLDGCIARMWNYVACPTCDFLLNETGPATAQAVHTEAPREQAPIADLTDLNRAFAHLDTLIAHVLTIPGMADHPDLKAQLDFINASKVTARAAQIEEFAAIKARLDRVAAAREMTDKKLEEQRKKHAETNAPMAALDGKALGESLLKRLGFVR